MAELSIAHQWADGTVTSISVEDDSLPAALFAVIALWRETCQVQE